MPGALPAPASTTRSPASVAWASYTEQDFAKGVTPAEISRSCQRMLDDLLEGRDGQLLANPHYRLNILVVKAMASSRTTIAAAWAWGWARWLPVTSWAVRAWPATSSASFCTMGAPRRRSTR